MVTLLVQCQYSDGYKEDWLTLEQAQDHMNKCRRAHNIRQEDKPMSERRWNLYMKDAGGNTVVIATKLTHTQFGFGHPANWEAAGGWKNNIFFYTEEVTNNVLSH